MAYIVKQFGNLIVPPYLRSGDSQDLGTGAALTSFLQLPGGGYYDNYQGGISPQGIRPISKSGLFIGDKWQLHEQLDAWRAMLGHRAKLVVEFDDGALRWQWARLQDVSTPRTKDNKQGWLPFTFTWITAAQNWRGVIRSDWTWGDGSWNFGDGSVNLGDGSYTSEMLTPQAEFLIYHTGTIDATNLKLRMDIQGAWNDLSIINATTGQTIFIDRTSTTARPWMEIDSGARTIYLAQETARTITAIYREQNRVWVLTDQPHNIPAHTISELTGGQSFRIENSGAYDGTYFPAITSYAGLATVTPNKFYFVVPGDFPAYTPAFGGKMTALFDIYDLATISDRRRWIVLAPGGYNHLFLSFSGSVVPTSAVLTAEFTDHHA